MLTENEMLQSMRFRSEVSLQITLDQDYNILDNKADMEKMVVENGEVQIQNVKVMQDKRKSFLENCLPERQTELYTGSYGGRVAF